MKSHYHNIKSVLELKKTVQCLASGTSEGDGPRIFSGTKCTVLKYNPNLCLCLLRTKLKHGLSENGFKSDNFINKNYLVYIVIIFLRFVGILFPVLIIHSEYCYIVLVSYSIVLLTCKSDKLTYIVWKVTYVITTKLQS